MLRRPNRRIVAAAILAFWVVMMAIFLKREGYVPFFGERKRAMSPRVMHPTDTWMGIYLGDDAQIGFVNVSTTPDTRDGKVGIALTATAKLQMVLLSAPTEIFISGAAWMPQDTGLAEFDFRVRSGEHAMQVSAKISDGRLDAEINTAGEIIPLKFPVGKDLLLSGVMGTTTLNIPDLEPGEEVSIDSFDPMTFSRGKTRVRCEGTETLDIAGEQIATKRLTMTLGVLTTEVWIDRNEDVVRAVTPFGLTMRKIAPQQAFASDSGTAAPGLLQMMSVTPEGKRPFRGAQRMVLRIHGIAEGHYPPTDDTQSNNGPVYTILQASEPQGPSAPPGESLAKYIEGDAFVQANHPRIKSKAAEIVGNERDPWKQAMALYQWTSETIEKKIVFSIPSALDVLDKCEGDCNEQTVLYAALARSLGIPARIAIGLAWSDELQGFYYHAWPEVYVGRWIWVDPTLDQPIADATRIKLLEGGIENWPQLLPFIGQVKLEILDIEP